MTTIDDKTAESDEETTSLDDETPPLGSWNALYGVIVAALVIQILVYLWITRWAS